MYKKESGVSWQKCIICHNFKRLNPLDSTSSHIFTSLIRLQPILMKVTNQSQRDVVPSDLYSDLKGTSRNKMIPNAPCNLYHIDISYFFSKRGRKKPIPVATDWFFFMAGNDFWRYEIIVNFFLNYWGEKHRKSSCLNSAIILTKADYVCTHNYNGMP